MWIMRRVLAILAVVAALFIGAAPAAAGGPDVCSAYCRERLVEVGLEGRVVQLVGDGDSTCALTEQGAVYCWGASRPEPSGPGVSALLLVTVGSLLVAGGASLLLLTRS
jgi:hypothetical protein